MICARARHIWDRFTGKAAIREHREWWASLSPEQRERDRRAFEEAMLWDDDGDLR